MQRLNEALAGWQPPGEACTLGRWQSLQRQLLPAATAVAEALQAHCTRPEQQQAARLQLARAACARACAHLRCAELGLEGGPAAGQRAGSSKCAACREAHYW